MSCFYSHYKSLRQSDHRVFIHTQLTSASEAKTNPNTREIRKCEDIHTLPGQTVNPALHSYLCESENLSSDLLPSEVVLWLLTYPPDSVPVSVKARAASAFLRLGCDTVIGQRGGISFSGHFMSLLCQLLVTMLPPHTCRCFLISPSPL